MLDSLVRVSRRVNENHFVRIANAASGRSAPVPHYAARTALLSATTRTAGDGNRAKKARIIDPQSTPPYRPRSITEASLLPSLGFSPAKRIDSDPPKAYRTHPPTITNHQQGLPSHQQPDKPADSKYRQRARLVSSASLLTISSTF